MSTIRIATWNIDEGTTCGSDQLSCLKLVSQFLTTRNVDIALLNEICIWNGWTNGGVNQIDWIADHAGYPYRKLAQAATLFMRGAKNVAVLSKFPLISAERIQHSAYLDGGGYATLRVTADINNCRHHIFSTRFTAWDVPENLQSHQTIRDIISAIPDEEAVIIGGDFNTGAGGVTNWPTSKPRTIDYNEFVTKTRLRHVLGDPGWTKDEWPADHLLFRGPYAIADANVGHPTQPTPPDKHPWVFVDLTSPPDYEIFSEGLISSSPAVCSWADNRLDVFARGTDNALWHKTFDGNSWSKWEQLGANHITSDPAAVSWGPNRIDVFVRGTDGGLYHKHWDGNHWSGYERIGSELIASGPAVSSGAAGRLDVFARGTDNAIWHKTFDGNSWSKWEQLGANQVASDPAAVSWGHNRIDVFARGIDHALYHKWWDGGWKP